MYDSIIVGAGSASCVLAYRLTENPEISVLFPASGQPSIYVHSIFPWSLTFLVLATIYKIIHAYISAIKLISLAPSILEERGMHTSSHGQNYRSQTCKCFSRPLCS